MLDLVMLYQMIQVKGKDLMPKYLGYSFVKCNCILINLKQH